MPAERPTVIPITVIGGYLGAGKTTLVNALLDDPGGRRIGVVVNDFGELGVDASLIEPHDGATVPIANLANGCVCCTLGEDLGTTLSEMAQIEPALDHIVIEASGVADPAATAAWGTLRPFAPGGVIVLAAADGVERMANDRYVGGEVRRQLVAADLVIVTKSDLVDATAATRVRRWLGDVTDAPLIDAAHGAVGCDVVLGAMPRGVVAAPSETTVVGSADDRYTRWSWHPSGTTRRGAIERFLSELPPGLLRLKGVLDVEDDAGAATTELVQVVGSSVSVTPVQDVAATGLEAIGVRGVFDTTRCEQAALKYLRPA